MALIAQYDGNCTQECGSRIHPGDWIVRDDDGYRHLECHPVPTFGMRPGEKVCETCWLIHPEGACSA